MLTGIIRIICIVMIYCLSDLDVKEYALGKTSGKANIRKNLETLGLGLDEDSMRKGD